MEGVFSSKRGGMRGLTCLSQGLPPRKRGDGGSVGASGRFSYDPLRSKLARYGRPCADHLGVAEVQVIVECELLSLGRSGSESSRLSIFRGGYQRGPASRQQQFRGLPARVRLARRADRGLTVRPPFERGTTLALATRWCHKAETPSGELS